MKPFLVLSCVISVCIAEPVPVELKPSGELLRGGKPYFIKGAGGSVHLEELARRGGNSFRTWGHSELPVELQTAQKLNLTVSAGIWLEPECNWFSYKNPEHCAKQLARVLEVVQQHKDHPALLAWGLGNESEGDGSLAAYWQQLEKLAQAVKKLDPAHPTFTAVAGVSKTKAEGLNKHTPSLDFLGINTYGALPGLRKKVVDDGWLRPWAVTEFGARGFWESPKTAWGAPLEAMPEAKAQFTKAAYEKAIQPGGICIGSYAFVWGQKNEATATWFGLLNEQGHTTPLVDVLEQVWTGKTPSNTAPLLAKLDSTAKNQKLAPKTEFEVRAEASDRENDALSWKWLVMSECTGQHDNLGRPFPPKSHPDCIINASGAVVKIKAPGKPGTYRVYAEVSDGKGHVASANFPFLVP